MTTRYHFTTAPVDYDYGCTQTEADDDAIRAAAGERWEGMMGDKVWRLVSIDSERIGGTFHKGQTIRYSSGLHPSWEADTEDTLSLGFPLLADLGLVPGARGHLTTIAKHADQIQECLWAGNVHDRTMAAVSTLLDDIRTKVELLLKRED